MTKYLLHGSYTTEGIQGVLKEGGSKRIEAVKQFVEALGCTLEAFYFAFGDDDFYFIMDGPDTVETLAGLMIANATGTVRVKTTVLISPEDIDKATKLTADYRPPGGK